MKKNVAGQKIGAQMIDASDGSAFTGAVTVYITGDAGSQALGSVGSGVCTHEGNGYHTYAPSQAESNYDLTAFTFIGTGAVPVTLQAYNTFPQAGDSFSRIGSTGSGLTSLALEATLTAMKGAGWSTETLATIEAAILGLIPTGARTITLQYYETATTDPIVGVKVTILNNAETVVVADRTTDINGQIVIALDDDTYKLRARQAGLTPAAVPETIVVSADATEILYGDSAVIAAPGDSDVCRVYEYLFLPDGETKPTTVISKAEITKRPYDKDSKLHSGDANEGTYDSSTGLIYWDIVRGATAKFFVKDFIGVTRVVPDVATQRLTDIA